MSLEAGEWLLGFCDGAVASRLIHSNFVSPSQHVVRICEGIMSKKMSSTAEGEKVHTF